jgi:CRISPR/Cas system endoribonuclease Cas6 (RAMP superfamily)
MYTTFALQSTALNNRITYLILSPLYVSVTHLKTYPTEFHIYFEKYLFSTQMHKNFCHSKVTTQIAGV